MRELWKKLVEFMTRPRSMPDMELFGDQPSLSEPEPEPEKPDYYCEVVSRDTYSIVELGDGWPPENDSDTGRIGNVAEGFYDAREDQFVLVIRV